MSILSLLRVFYESPSESLLSFQLVSYESSEPLTSLLRVFYEYFTSLLSLLEPPTCLPMSLLKVL
jgi:hypothetical protein